MLYLLYDRERCVDPVTSRVSLFARLRCPELRHTAPLSRVGVVHGGVLGYRRS